MSLSPGAPSSRSSGHAGPPPGPVANLDIGAAVRAVFASIFKHPGAVLRTLFLPALLTSFLAVLQKDLPLDDPARFFALPLAVLPMTLAAVTWHRFQLLGEAPGSLPRVGRPYLAFYIWFWVVWLIVFLSVLLVTTPLSLLIAALGDSGLADAAFPIILALAFAASAAVYLRLCFVFPASALGERYGLGDSWRQTKGQTLRIFIVALMTSVPVVLVTLMVAAMLADTLGHDPAKPYGLPLSVILLFSFAQLLMVLPFISTLSVAFRQISGWVSPE
ncbi:hypothetical protein [Limibacillus halophilus]|uniref:Glycerophosphoryl diester phosphodiesterase membrane domain-containing protein n=1 Tax=Limibacillus halophilus TaxID=1579333 RepID=A0A839SRM5_9PROT|nr:hypothetical protein [Limibacillus halophilus]MBB3064006.1 hypothetical protein [Limibacillus halophilus]